MSNKFAELNDHLFAQMNRLSKEDLSAEEIEKEVARTEAIVKVADKVISNGNLALSACKVIAEHGNHLIPNLPMLEAPPTGYEKEDYAGKKTP